MSTITNSRSSRTAQRATTAAGAHSGGDDQGPHDTQCRPVVIPGSDSGGDDQRHPDTYTTAVVIPGSDSGGDDHRRRDTYAPSVVIPGAHSGGDDQRTLDTHTLAVVIPGLTLADPILALLATAVDDLEGLRKAQASRLRILTSTEPDSDGEERGFGLDATDPTVRSVQAVHDGLATLEHETVLALQRAMRKHPLGPYVKARRGLGEKTVARLLGCIGDPAVNPATGELRTFGQLVSYAGMAPVDGKARAKRRGEQVNWNGDARMRLWNCVQPAIKMSGPYRDVYDAARVRYADAMHPVACVRCGPKGKPAEAGSPLSLAHQHARAVRLMMRAALRDLWVEARRLHGIQEN